MSETLYERQPVAETLPTGTDTAEVDANKELRQLLREEDNRLIESYRQTGDDSALMEAIGHHRSAMFSIGSKSFANREDVEDAVQSALIRAWQNIGQYEVGTNLGAWISTITKHECINLVRKQQCRPQKSGQDEGGYWAERTRTLFNLPTRESDPETAVVEGDHKALVAALEKLDNNNDSESPIIEEAVVAVHLDDLPHEQHAAKADIPIGTSLSRSSRGIRKLLEQAGVEKKKKSEYTRADILKMANFLNGTTKVEANLAD